MPRKTFSTMMSFKRKIYIILLSYGLLYLCIIFKILIKIIMAKSRNLGFPQATNTINWGSFWLYSKLFHILLFQTSLFLWLATSFQILDFPGGSDGKASTCNAGGPGLIPRSGRSPGEGTSNPLQYSCLENAMGRGAWRATVHGLEKSLTQLSD